MLKLTALFASFAFVTFAQATSLHPCTPVVPAKPTVIFCNDGGESISIQINTLMSPAKRMCRGKNYFEFKTADVTLPEATEPTVVLDGDFEYTLSPSGDATFSSESLGLDLTSCVTPIHGAVSFGN
jgi:hypothetical protein